MARILIVDDDATLLDVLSLSFEDEGHQVLTAADGNEGLRRVGTDHPDLVISDVNMPGLDGFTLCRRLREAGDGVPLILLTSRDHEVDEAVGLDLGADDYVTKPFSTRVLLARVAALLRRETLRAGSGSPAEDEALQVGQLELSRERLDVRWRGEGVAVTVSEFRLLDALANRPGVVFTRDQLLDRVRGSDSVVVDRIIDTWIRRLRKKFLAVDPTFDRIETVVGAGYRWAESGP
jgi:DNA-binding response OmpR family regulator